jgi:hypothetical protein
LWLGKCATKQWPQLTKATLLTSALKNNRPTNQSSINTFTPAISKFTVLDIHGWQLLMGE